MSGRPSPFKSATAREEMRFSEAMDSMRKRASGGSSFGSRLPAGLGFCGQVGLAGLVVEQVDPGAGIIDHDDVVQAVAIEVRHVQLADLAVNGEYLRAGEAEAVGVGGGGQAVHREAHAGSPNQRAAEPCVGTK